MHKLILAALVPVLLNFTSCVTPVPVAAPNGPVISNDGSRNFVLIMHGESCDAENVASNMYCENSHETATIIVTVDITWTENGQPLHENRTVTVAPDNKTLLGCEWRENTYQRFEIVSSKYQ